MNSDCNSTRGFVVIILACILLSATTAVSQNEASLTWPLQLDADFGQVVVYQPQLESYANNVLEARAAVSVTQKGKTEPVFGAIWFEAHLLTDIDTRIATCEDLRVTAAKFPTEDDRHVQTLARFLENEIPQWEMTISIDDLVAGLETAQGRQLAAEQLKNDPPEMIFVDHPAVLVPIDGEPILADMEGYNLKYVANTAFFIVQEPASKRYYLKGGTHWYTASDLMGEWTTTDNLPQEVQRVAKAIAEEEKKQAAESSELADSTGEAADMGDAEIPEIIVRTTPAELIQTDGPPKFASVEGTELLYVDNTETDVIMDLASQQYYVLLSGRWYRSSSLKDGKWTFVQPDELPVEFANVPAQSDMSQVRASVPGTVEAKEAVLENEIPQTAEIDRKTATVEVAYDGDPKFEKCTDGVAYALNTDKSVLLVDGTYYCCDQAVWFVSKGPHGPWEVATAVPNEIQTLPPECPVYNVKYVYIYKSTPDVVYVGYTPGYTGSYVYYGTVVYGTGYWYRPWYHRYYYPRPVTWGFHVHYNPVSGWGFSYGVSYGWLHIGVGRPWYGGWWGPSGYRHGYHSGYRHGYHHGARAGYRAGYRAGQASAYNNVYKARKQGVRSTGTAATRARAGTANRSATTVKKTPKAANRQNNVYAGKNGQVYRKQGDNWQKRDKSGWSRSKGSKQNLNRDYNSRQRSSQKSRQQKPTKSRGGGKKR
jgi:hypothetical protein